MPGTGKTACVHAIIKKLRIEAQNNELNENNYNLSTRKNTDKGKSTAKKSKCKFIIST